MLQFSKKNLYHILLWFFIVLYIIYFSYLTIMRFRTLYASYFDLGIMNQTVYNTYKGIVDRDPSRILEMTAIDGSSQIKRMAIHSDVLLAFLAPFYFLHSGPETLLVIQTVIVGLGAWFICKIAVEIFSRQNHKHLIGLVFALSYLLYSPLERANIFDFHAVTLATTLLLAMFYFWLMKQYKLSLLFFILSILSKEQVALTTAIFGLYTIFASNQKESKKNMFYSLTVIVTSVLWFVAAVFFIIPYFRGDKHFAVGRYSDFGDSPIRIIIGIVKSPYSIIKYLFHTDTWRYFLFTLGPVAFLPVFSPIMLFIAAPEFAINLLSNDWNMRNIIYHYTAVITPFVFMSALYAAKKIGESKQRIVNIKTILVTLVIATAVFAYFKGPLPLAREQEVHPILYPQKEAKEVWLWAKTLKDDNLKVSATGHLAPFFTSRRYFYNFSQNYELADYVILRREEVFNYPEKDELIPVYQSLQKDKGFEIIYKNGQLEVYKKNLKFKI